MKNGELDVQFFEPQIQAILRALAPSECQLVLDPSVQEWAQRVGIVEKDPFRAAMAVTQHGMPAIVVRKRISHDIQRSVIGAMEFRGFGDETGQLHDPMLFLEHLILHEIAHLVLDTDSEPACDRWAFDHLDRRLRHLDVGAT